MSEHSLILEFYKPTYNLDFDYNDDGGLDLHFTENRQERCHPKEWLMNCRKIVDRKL